MPGRTLRAGHLAGYLAGYLAGDQRGTLEATGREDHHDRFLSSNSASRCLNQWPCREMRFLGYREGISENRGVNNKSKQANKSGGLQVGKSQFDEKFEVNDD